MGCDITPQKEKKEITSGKTKTTEEKRVLLLGLDNAGKTSILI